MKAKAGIVGASGYSGGVAARLIAAHPRLELAFVTSDKLAGTQARAHLGALVPSDLVFAPSRDALEHAASCDVVLLATPAEIAAELAPRLLAASPAVSVVDLSGAFRLGPGAAYAEHYGFDHPAVKLLGTAWYGLPELFGPPPPPI